jgi:hypothetical protein
MHIVRPPSCCASQDLLIVAEKTVNTKSFSFKMKKRKELLILVFVASVCIHIILFLLNAIQFWPHVEKTVTNTVSSMWGKIA